MGKTEVMCCNAGTGQMENSGSGRVEYVEKELEQTQ
jgi:hypothetical protein